jgi:hypothetical protein
VVDSAIRRWEKSGGQTPGRRRGIARTFDEPSTLRGIYRPGRRMARKRKTIYNSRTGVTYTLRQRSTSAGKAGTIKGKRPARRKKKGFWDSLFG